MRRPKRFLSACAVVMLMTGLGTACGEDDGARTSDTTAADQASSDSSAPASQKAGTVTIKDFKFAPLEVQAKVGDTITVVNDDDAEHSLTALDKSFDSGRFTRSTRTFQVNGPGRFEFQCDVHPFMEHGFIQVVA